ncbi:MAG: response regulator [Deltaproteobacteria bacterium]|nr:response regulator [Deltaproteobacteria bacterium]MBN2846753.1 response regulator [Deltaproteobacteria bacterium]
MTDQEFMMGDETLLLVDDEEPILDVNREILEILGYRVVVAASGSEAIETFRSGCDFDLVLLDMIMPGMSGAETFDALRIINPDIKIILVTGYSFDGQAAAILEKGCNGFIQKPFRIANLSRIIRKVLTTPEQVLCLNPRNADLCVL